MSERGRMTLIPEEPEWKLTLSESRTAGGRMVTRTASCSVPSGVSPAYRGEVLMMLSETLRRASEEPTVTGPGKPPGPSCPDYFRPMYEGTDVEKGGK